jgi:hypothetical protein
MHKEFTETLTALNECIAECNHCFSACLQEQDVKVMARCIQLDRDCADICQLTAKLLQSGSEVSREALRLCITVCEACADECDRHTKIQHCKDCAEACRRCVQACSKALSTAPGMRAVQ